MQALASTPLQAAAVGNVAVVSVAERLDPKGMFMHKELSVKSRVRGDFHARFCERVRVKLPRSTRPMILLNTEAGDTECIFFKFSEDTAVLHKVKTLLQ